MRYYLQKYYTILKLNVFNFIIYSFVDHLRFEDIIIVEKNIRILNIYDEN